VDNKRIFIWSGWIKSVFDFEGTSFSEFAFSSWWFSQDIFAVVTGDDWLGMAEDYGSFVASSALDIHKIGVWGLN
jgi:roadblock/LC7 domain-containing protein